MERLSPLDASVLATETPSQHIHVLATLLLDPPADLPAGAPAGPGSGLYARFQRRVAERFSAVEPLRRRLVRLPLGEWAWADDPDVDVSRHLHHVVLDGGGLEEVARVAAQVASCPLPRDRPLWEVWFVEGLDSGQAAVIAKVHHAAVDGVSGIASLAAFFDLEASPASQPAQSAQSAQPEWTPAPRPGALELARSTVGAVTSRPATRARALGRLAALGLGALQAAAQGAPSPGDGARRDGAPGDGAPGATARGDGPPGLLRGPRLSFNRALTARRSVAFAQIDLSEIKELRRSLGATVNDVVMALCAGVVRQYLAAHGELPDRALAAAVPVSERLPEHGPGGNRFSFMLYGLPVHLDDPAGRMAYVQQWSAAAKDSYGRRGPGLLADLAGAASPGVISTVMRGVSGLRLANVVPPLVNLSVSNVRGPDMPLYVAGSRLRAMFPMGPLVEGVGLGITVVGYGEQVGFGFLTCPDVLADVDALAAELPLELDRLRRACRA